MLNIPLQRITDKRQTSILTFGDEFGDKYLIEYWSFSHKLLYKQLQSGVLYSLQVNFHYTIFSFHTYGFPSHFIRTSQSEPLFQSATVIISRAQESVSNPLYSSENNLGESIFYLVLNWFTRLKCLLIEYCKIIEIKSRSIASNFSMVLMHLFFWSVKCNALFEMSVALSCLTTKKKFEIKRK